MDKNELIRKLQEITDLGDVFVYEDGMLIIEYTDKQKEPSYIELYSTLEDRCSVNIN